MVENLLRWFEYVDKKHVDSVLKKTRSDKE